MEETINTQNHDFDDVYKTMKCNHPELFIAVINDAFGTHYSSKEPVEILPSDGYFTTVRPEDGCAEIVERSSDLFIKIKETIYLLECQSYHDGSMAIRIVEYAFIAARQNAVIHNSEIHMTMPYFSVIYIRKARNTPRTTDITWSFPDGSCVNYSAPNIILEDYSKEDIIEKKLYPYLPYYVLRYEKQIRNGDSSSLNAAVADLNYLRIHLQKAMEEHEIDARAFENLKSFTNTIITHIARDSKTKERLVNTMGGKIIVTEADKIWNDGKSIGWANGWVECEQTFSKLISLLLDAGRNEDMQKALTDADARQQLYHELGLLKQ